MVPHSVRATASWLGGEYRTPLEWDPRGKKEKILKLGINNKQPMAEKPSTSGPPPTIIIHPGNKDSTDEKTTGAEVDIPAPVKAFSPEAPPTPSTNRNWESLTGAGMLAVMASPFMFLFLALAPETEQDTIALLAGALFFFGLFCIVLGASKTERRKTPPRTVIIPEQPTEEKDSSPHTAALEVRSDNPWIDDGDDSRSFWASMVEDHYIIPSIIGGTPIEKYDIPVSSRQWKFEDFVFWNLLFSPFYFILIILGGPEACIGILTCQCMFLPEILIAMMFQHPKKNSTTEPGQGASAIWVIVLIALAALMIIAFYE